MTDSHPPLIPPAQRPRDLRLDFWRGLCLVDMLIVHMVHGGASFGRMADLWLVEYLRFAAGGFILVAGLSVGAIFLPRAMDPDKRARTYMTIWRRAGWILVVHYLVEIAFLIRMPFPGDVWPAFGRNVLDVLILRSGMDLLPLYVCLLLVSPILLELLRRKLWLVVAVGSIGLFALGQVDPYRFALPMQQTFFPMLWQLLFVAGLLVGAKLRDIDRINALRLRRWTAGIVAAAVGLIACSYATGLGMWLPVTFSKVPLTLAEASRYILLMFAIMLLTRRIRLQESPVLKVVCLLGQYSLLSYVLHIWLVAAVLRVLPNLGWPTPSSLACLIVALGMLAMAAMFRTRRQDWLPTITSSRLARAAVLLAFAVMVLPRINAVVWPPAEQVATDLDAEGVPDAGLEMNDSIDPADVIPDYINNADEIEVA